MPIGKANEAARLIALVDEMNRQLAFVDHTTDWQLYCEAQVRRLLRTERDYAHPNEPAGLREMRYDLIGGYGQAAYKAKQELKEFQESRTIPPRFAGRERLEIAGKLVNQHLSLTYLQGQCRAILRSKRDYEEWLDQLLRAKRELAAELRDHDPNDLEGEDTAEIRQEIDRLDKKLTDRFRGSPCRARI